MISQEMRCLLPKVHDFILNGWSFSVDQNSDYSPYYNHRYELGGSWMHDMGKPCNCASEA